MKIKTTIIIIIILTGMKLLFIPLMEFILFPSVKNDICKALNVDMHYCEYDERCDIGDTMKNYIKRKKLDPQKTKYIYHNEITECSKHVNEQETPYIY